MSDIVAVLRRAAAGNRLLWTTDGDVAVDPEVFRVAADEIDRLRTAIIAIGDLHQPMWVSAEAKAAGKAPWVCCWCGVADGSWPCDTRLLADEAVENLSR